MIKNSEVYLHNVGFVYDSQKKLWLFYPNFNNLFPYSWTRSVFVK
jgi:hypothetical protein